MIRGIIFDCFGVLYQGSIAHLQELVPASKRAELANLSLSSDYGYVTREEFLSQASELIGKSVTEIEAIMQADHIRNVALVDCVRSLRRDYKIALLSNVGRGVIERLFTAEELAELFDVVVLSSEVGMVKPEPEIYRYTAGKLDLTEEQCLMIDDLASNIEGALSVGMRGIVFKTTDIFVANLTDQLSAPQAS
jgi:putative hydrolase of the HAD superfamily